MTDAELVERSRGGDSDAFGELVNRHRSAVYRASVAALGSRAEAEDAAQDAFITAYRRLDSFRGEASFKTWLLTIAWRQAINRRRSLARVWRRIVAPAPDEESDSLVAAVAAAGPTPEEAAADDQLRRAVEGAIRALPPKLRDTLLLAQSDAYSYDEISAMVKAPRGTIKWRVSEARRIVKQRLREQGYGDVG